MKIIKNEIPTKDKDAWDDESDSDIGRSICYGGKEIKHKSEIGSKINKKIYLIIFIRMHLRF